MRRRWWPASIPWFGAGRATTGAWSHPGSSPGWTATCGTSPGGGDVTRIRTSRGAGLPAGTTACSAGSGRFGDPETGAYLSKASWTKIVRHVLVRTGASPDDPVLAGYWADRRRKRKPPPLGGLTLKLLKAQDDRCPACGELLIDAGQEPQSPQAWEQWFIDARRTLRKQRVVQRAEDPVGERISYRLVHAHCLRRQAG